MGGDLIVLLDKTSSPSLANKTKEDYKKESEEKILDSNPPEIAMSKLNILICGWNNVWALDHERLKKRIEETAQFCSEGSIFIFVNLVSFENFEMLMNRVGYRKSSERLSSIQSHYCNTVPLKEEANFEYQIYEIEVESK